jgi:hypothetical protein
MPEWCYSELSEFTKPPLHPEAPNRLQMRVVLKQSLSRKANGDAEILGQAFGTLPEI